jgi:hypothetical protein
MSFGLSFCLNKCSALVASWPARYVALEIVHHCCDYYFFFTSMEQITGLDTTTSRQQLQWDIFLVFRSGMVSRKSKYKGKERIGHPLMSRLSSTHILLKLLRIRDGNLCSSVMLFVHSAFTIRVRVRVSYMLSDMRRDETFPSKHFDCNFYIHGTNHWTWHND